MTPIQANQCSARFDRLARFFNHQASPKRLSVSKAYKCASKVKSTSPTMAIDRCDESSMSIMAYGGQGSASNQKAGCRKHGPCPPDKKATLPNDAVKQVPLRLWWKWGRLRNSKKGTDSFLARFCINMKDDYTPGRDHYLKNSYGVLRDSKKVPRRIDGTPDSKDLNKMFRNVANMYKDPENKHSMFLSYRVVADYRTCKFKMDVYTGFAAGRRKADRYHGEPKLGGSVIVFDSTKLEPGKKADPNLYAFSGPWDRSILTDNYSKFISKSQLAWVYHRLGASKPMDAMNWGNWDLQRKVELRLKFDPQNPNMYSIAVWRHYRVFRHRKVPGEASIKAPVGQWTGLGVYTHNYQKLYVIDREQGRNSTEGNGDIARQVRQSDTAKLKKYCPWALKSLKRMDTSFEKFEAEQRRGKFNIPGQRFTRINSRQENRPRQKELINTKARGCLYQSKKYLTPRSRSRLATAKSKCKGASKLTFELIPTPAYTFLTNGSAVRFKTRYGQYLWVSRDGRQVKQKPLLLPTHDTTFTLKVRHNGRLENNAKIALKCHNGRYLKKRSNGTWQCRQRRPAWFRAKMLKPTK